MNVSPRRGNRRVTNPGFGVWSMVPEPELMKPSVNPARPVAPETAAEMTRSSAAFPSVTLIVRLPPLPRSSLPLIAALGVAALVRFTFCCVTLRLPPRVSVPVPVFTSALKPGETCIVIVPLPATVSLLPFKSSRPEDVTTSDITAMPPPV